MITNSGINLLSKYIAGQLPTFASHIAIGCGPNAVSSVSLLTDYSIKTSMDFEMLRVPITSRAVRIVDGESYVVFTGELPSADRYAFTEIGIYPAEKSNIFGSTDSFILNSFSNAESWIAHNNTASSELNVESEVEISGLINPDSGDSVFILNSENAMFSGDRLTRQEQPRYLNEAIAIKGNYSSLSSGSLVYTGKHIHTSVGDLSALDAANEVVDELRLGFSVASKSAVEATNPSAVKIAIDFCSNDPDAAAPTTYARWIMTPTVTSTDRYQVETTKIYLLTKTSDFTWAQVKYIRIYANIDSSADYYLLLDTLRFENLSALDSQYSLGGYTVVVNTNSQPIIKEENGASLIEYRFKVKIDEVDA
jgi:hypothetical protein